MPKFGDNNWPRQYQCVAIFEFHCNREINRGGISGLLRNSTSRVNCVRLSRTRYHALIRILKTIELSNSIYNPFFEPLRSSTLLK